MPAIFERDVKNLLKQLGRKELRPVNCLKSAFKFRQFNVIRTRKPKFLSQFWKQPDIPTEFSLLDILEPNPLVPETAVMGPFVYSDNLVQELKGDMAVGVGTGLQMGVSVEAGQSHVSSLNFHIINVPIQTWTELRLRKRLDPEPWFLKQCREREEQLYVVTEAVEVTNSPVLHSSKSVKGLGKCSNTWDPLAKVQGQVECLNMGKETLVLPQGTVMAYQRKKLIIKKDGWGKGEVKEAKEKEVCFS